MKPEELIKHDYERLRKLVLKESGVIDFKSCYLDRYTNNIKQQAKKEVFDDLDRLNIHFSVIENIGYKGLKKKHLK